MFFHGFADELTKLALPTEDSYFEQDPSMGHGGKGEKYKRIWRPGGYYVLKKIATVSETAKQLATIARHNPAKLKEIAKAVTGGPGGSIAKGVTYGAAGYSALKGLGYRDPRTRRREPLEGAARGALKGGSVGALAALVFRYPALRKAVARHAVKAQR